MACNYTAGKPFSMFFLLASLCTATNSAFSETLVPNKNINLEIGITYALKSTNNGLFELRERAVAIPLSLSVDVSNSISATINTSMLRTSNQRITTSDAFTTSSSGVGDVGLSFSYQKAPIPSSSWPSYSVNVGVVLPTGEQANSTEVGSSSTGDGVRSASIGFGLTHTSDPVALFANIALGYEQAYNFQELEIQPGRNFIYGFGVSFYVNEEIVLTSRISGTIEKDLKIDNTTISGTGSESMSLSLGLRYLINQEHTFSPNFNIGLGGDTKSLGLSYSRNF